MSTCRQCKQTVSERGCDLLYDGLCLNCVWAELLAAKDLVEKRDNQLTDATNRAERQHDRTPSWLREEIDRRVELTTLREKLKELLEAAIPFTSGDTVDETSGTIPLMIRLEHAIEAAQAEGGE